MIKYDHYDEAIIGPALIWRDQQRVGVLVYDAEKIREILMRDGMMPRKPVSLSSLISKAVTWVLTHLYWFGHKMNGMVSMTREDIVRMAKEAGFYIEHNEIYSMSTQSDHELTEPIERFAKLVAQHEREAILAVIGDNQCECRCSEVVRDRGKV
jgi:hypothetical protein